MRKLIILFVLVVVASCDSTQEFDEFVAMPNNQWSKPVHFKVEVNDTIGKKNAIINVRNNKDFAYNNLFLITKLELPNGSKITDTLEYEMTDADGRFLGSGYTDTKENYLLYRENIVFDQKGIYNITIEQAMRKMGEEDGIKALNGITDVGFRVEKVTK